MKNMGSKTVFSAVCFTNKLTSFGMGSSLGALLANIMNELEQKIIKQFVSDDTTISIRITFVLIKPEHNDVVYKTLNN